MYVLLVRFKGVVYLNKLHVAISFSGQEAHVSVGVEQRNKNSENNRPRFVKDGDRYERRNDSADLPITINYNTVGFSELVRYSNGGKEVGYQMVWYSNAI